MALDAHERRRSELTSLVEQRRAHYLQMKAAQADVIRKELREARDAYEDALMRLSHFIECDGSCRGSGTLIGRNAESRWRAVENRKRSNCRTDALLHAKHPERICWGCERYCPSKDLACREERVPHPIEPFGYAPESTSLQLPGDITSPASKASASSAEPR